MPDPTALLPGPDDFAPVRSAPRIQTPDPRMLYVPLWFVGFMVLMALFYYSAPDWHLLTWTIIGFGGAAAVVVGARLNRPADPRPWYLLSAAMMTLISGDTLYNVLTDVFGVSPAVPFGRRRHLSGDVPLAAGGIMLMIRHRSPRRDWVALVDAMILTAASALLLWVFTITPTVADESHGWLNNAVSIAYPLGDVLVLAVMLRLVTAGGVHFWSVKLLILGIFGLIGSDVAYALVRLYGTWHVGSAADIGWIVFYAAWGAAALHPSMVRLTEEQRRVRRVSSREVLPLAFAALVAPTVLLVEALAGRGRLRDAAVIAVFSGFTFLLVLVRLVLQGRELREQDNLAHSRAMVRELRQRAYRDSLTGLGNRLFFQERAEVALDRARRMGGEASMLLIDLDNFKEVNDTQGHRAGDELLIAAARRLASAVRPGDLPVRLGGDEFAVLLADGAGHDSAVALAQRLERVFSEPYRVSDGVLQIRASIGVASSDGRLPSEHGVESEEVLFRNADLALYAAKADGKGTWRSFEPYLYDAALERLRLRNSLERAIDNEEFVLHYQPIVDLRGPTRVSGFEALARWQNPELGRILGPDQFIPLAEETGQIIPLGRWIIRKAITDAARCNAGAPDGRARRFAVNVSAHQFEGRGLVETVTEALEETGLAAELVVLEITETVFLHEQEHGVFDNLEALAALGVRIAIDDFGTGYSSIGYLKKLNFDLLKADKTFVEHIADRQAPEHETLLRGIVHVAGSLGIEVVAEGVETAAQRDVLRAMGCHYAQGFLYSPAVPLEEVPGVVAALERKDA